MESSKPEKSHEVQETKTERFLAERCALAGDAVFMRILNREGGEPPQVGDALGEMDVTTAAKKLHVSRTTHSRILNGAVGISADMSLRLSAALGTHDSLWYELQMSYDIRQAAQKKRPKIERFVQTA